jgi:putative transcription factor
MDSDWDKKTVIYNKKLIQKNRQQTQKTVKTVKTVYTVKSRQIESNEELYNPPKIEKKISEMIRLARCSKNIKQKELAIRINVPVKTITDYENGNAVPSNMVLGKIEKILSVKLRGTIGS